MTQELSTNCCSKASTELKIDQIFLFAIPIMLIFFLLFILYLFYLRRTTIDWRSLRMTAPFDSDLHENRIIRYLAIGIVTVRTNDELHENHIIRSEMGLKKEHREMLPIIIFKESFSVKDTQCPVCLADYQAEERLQQIPACGHTFHMCCIDLWLATRPTCPLCRLSLIPSPKPSDRLSDIAEISHNIRN